MRFGILLIALVGCGSLNERPQVYTVADLKDWTKTAIQNGPWDTQPGPLICSDSVLNDQAKSGFGLNITYWQPCYPMYDHMGLERRKAIATEQKTLEKEMQPVPTVTELLEENPGHAQAVIARAQEEKARAKAGLPPAQTARR